MMTTPNKTADIIDLLAWLRDGDILNVKVKSWDFQKQDGVHN